MIKGKTCGIYCIENIVNNKKYIGQSINIIGRFNEHRFLLRHKKHNNDHFQKSWDKYGEENFKFYILVVCEKHELDRLEILLINLFDVRNRENGYNQDGGGNVNKEISQETRYKISLGSKGHKRWLGRKHSEETKAKMSINRIGKRKSKEFSDKMSEKNIGSKHADASIKYLGVSYYKNRFVVKLTINRKAEYLGRFTDVIDAAKVYDKKSWEIYHNLLKLNFPADYLDMT